MTPQFLAGGGEVGERLRSMDWSRTALGPPELWPQSLKTVVRIMLDSKYAMWMLWGPEFTFLCNDSYLPTVGIKREWVLGSRSDKVWEEIWPEIGPRIEHVLKTGEATWDEALMLFLERNGYAEETYHTFSYSPLHDDAGTIAGMLCVVTEVTDRVISERRLAFLSRLGGAVAGANADEDIAKAMTSSAAQGSADLPFTAIYMMESDRKFARRVGRTGFSGDHAAIPERLPLSTDVWPLEEVIGDRHAVSVDRLTTRFEPLPGGPWGSAPDEARILPIVEQGMTLASGFVIVGLNPFRPLDQAYRHFLELMTAQLASGFSAVHVWAEERRRAQALAELDRAKSDFFANVSHEFRTPLTLMIGPIEDAIKDAANSAPSIQSRLELAHRNSLRLLKLVNSLLDFSRLEANRTQPNFQAVELGRFTAELASGFRGAIERAGLRFRVECPAIDRPIAVDRDMWEKIVFNLLTNAFKYTLAGEIFVSVIRGERGIDLHVRDTGSGIPPEALPHIFERFYRVPDAPARTHEGTGIGLSMVHELVGLHGGTISVRSERGKGTEFTVSIPFDHHPVRDSSGTEPTTPMAGGRIAGVEDVDRWVTDAPVPDVGAGSAETGGRLGTIVLAEDNADMRSYLQQILCQQFTVVALRDGQEALEHLRRCKPDLLLSDIMMPRLDGVALLNAVRAEPSLSDLPVILLTARAGEEARIEGWDVGADDYLVKPFSARELIARVRSHISMSQARRAASAAIRASDQRFKVALEASTVGFALLGAVRGAEGAIVDFTYLDLNSAAASTLRHPAAELVGRRVGEILPWTWKIDGVFDAYVHVANTGEPRQFDVEARHAGRTRWYHVAAARLNDGVAVWFADITDRKRDMLAVDASRQELQRVTDTASVLLVHFDRDLRVRFANRAYAAQFGLDAGQLIGRSYEEIAGEERIRGDRHNLRRVLAGERVEFEMVVRHAGGGERFMSCVYAPDFDDSGTAVDGFVAAMTDISDRHRLERALREADRRKDEFLATLAHELRNPLAPIRHAAAIAKVADVEPEKLAWSLSVINRQVEQMAHLLEDLLDIARITQGKLQLRMQGVELRTIVDAAIEAARPAIDAKSHTLIVNAMPPGISLHADQVRLAQVLSNVLNNAAKYTDRSGRIELSFDQTSDGRVQINVKDNGVGIRREALSGIFEMFSQVDSALDRAEGGLGIGLSLVKGLVELHGGSVSVRSDGAGRGSEFSILLPLGGPPSAARIERDGRQDAPPEVDAKRILVADDNRDAAETLQMLLQMEGHEVRVAYDGEEAVQVATAFRPDLVLLDIGMPKINGYEVAATLRKRFPPKSMTLVALTGWGQSNDKHRAFAAGFDRHLTKPVPPDLIQKILSEMSPSIH